jgi:hypothetical protein
MQKAGMTRSGRPYQYKLNRKKREVAKRVVLESDEEEVEDLSDLKHIEETFFSTYERNIRGEGSYEEENTPIQIQTSVELLSLDQVLGDSWSC